MKKFTIEKAIRKGISIDGARKRVKSRISRVKRRSGRIRGRGRSSSSGRTGTVNTFVKGQRQSARRKRKQNTNPSKKMSPYKVSSTGAAAPDTGSSSASSTSNSNAISGTTTTATTSNNSTSNIANDRVEWSRSTILGFIEDYRRERVLWDPNTKGYHIKQIKYEALKALGSKYGTEIRSIRSKIKSLRSSFHREHGKVINGRRKGVHYQPMWFAYEAIRFILDGEVSDETAMAATLASATATSTSVAAAAAVAMFATPSSPSLTASSSLKRLKRENNGLLRRAKRYYSEARATKRNSADDAVVVVCREGESDDDRNRDDDVDNTEGSQQNGETTKSKYLLGDQATTSTTMNDDTAPADADQYKVNTASFTANAIVTTTSMVSNIATSTTTTASISNGCVTSSAETADAAAAPADVPAAGTTIGDKNNNINNSCSHSDGSDENIVARVAAAMAAAAAAATAIAETGNVCGIYTNTPATTTSVDHHHIIANATNCSDATTAATADEHVQQLVKVTRSSDLDNDAGYCNITADDVKTEIIESDSPNAMALIERLPLQLQRQQQTLPFLTPHHHPAVPYVATTATPATTSFTTMPSPLNYSSKLSTSAATGAAVAGTTNDYHQQQQQQHSMSTNNSRKRKSRTPAQLTYLSHDDLPSPSKQLFNHQQHQQHPQQQQQQQQQQLQIHSNLFGNHNQRNNACELLSPRSNNSNSNAHSENDVNNNNNNANNNTKNAVAIGTATTTSSSSSSSSTLATSVVATPHSQHQHDEYGVFGEYVAITIRKLKTSKAKIVVKHLINNLLYEAELGKYDHGIPATKEPPQLYKM